LRAEVQKLAAADGSCHFVFLLFLPFSVFQTLLENQKTKTQKPRLHTPRRGVVAESWVLSFFFGFLVKNKRKQKNKNHKLLRIKS
jgi:hypothetical protein